MQYSLLNFTKKTSVDLRPLFRRPDLLVHPFDKATSRIAYKADYFRFDPHLPSLADDLSHSKKSMSWEACCESRAKELLKLNRQHYIVSYSGGIDSTALLVSLMKYWPTEALKKVTISLSHDSIDENLSFFENYVSRFRLINSMRSLDSVLLSKDALLLTGELGDQLFGSDLLDPAVQMFGEELIQQNYKDGFAKLIRAWSPPDASRAGALAEHFFPIVDACPFPIRSLHDFVWWFNFTQKWHHVKYRFYEMTTASLNLRYGSHIMHFYDSPDFQRWSLENHDLKIRKSWKSYKWKAKEFIYDFTKDPAQLELLKIQSLEKTYFLDTKRIAVDSSYRPVASNEELMTYAIL